MPGPGEAVSRPPREEQVRPSHLPCEGRGRGAHHRAGPGRPSPLCTAPRHHARVQEAAGELGQGRLLVVGPCVLIL